MTAPVSAIIVAYYEPDGVRRAIRSLLDQTTPPAEILVIDNSDGAEVVQALEPEGLPVRLLPSGANLGYARGCDLAATHATQPWLFFVNPDAEAEPDCVERLLEAATDDVAITGAQVLLPGGEQVNAGDNPVHISGLSWSGRYLEEREHAPAREAACVSGAALMVRAAVFRDLGGHSPGIFLYHDDVDLCWRSRLAGWRVLFVPRAAVRHDYQFGNGALKWYELEHNRLWTLLSNYEARTLLLLAPVLLAAELGITALALRDGWWTEKRRCWAALVRERREIRRWRRHVQGLRRGPDAAVLERMTGRLDTTLVQAPGAGAAGAALEAYRRALLPLTR